jgi:hypothetical protein
MSEEKEQERGGTRGGEEKEGGEAKPVKERRWGSSYRDSLSFKWCTLLWSVVVSKYKQQSCISENLVHHKYMSSIRTLCVNRIEVFNITTMRQPAVHLTKGKILIIFSTGKENKKIELQVVLVM